MICEKHKQIIKIETENFLVCKFCVDEYCGSDFVQVRKEDLEVLKKNTIEAFKNSDDKFMNESIDIFLNKYLSEKKQ